MAGEDFVHVKLTTAGVAIADGGNIVIAGSSYDFTFAPDAAQRVTRSDWERFLQHETLNGETLFELAEE